jgi:hypothetical protein
VGSIERRIEVLEDLLSGQGREEDPAAELRREIMRTILDEFGRLRACRANGHYRGGTPPTPIQPTDPAGEVLGYPYTTGELLEFCVRTVFERGEAAEDLGLSAAALEDLIAAWSETLREQSAFGPVWDEVQADGPPEPTPPWH